MTFDNDLSGGSEHVSAAQVSDMMRCLEECADRLVLLALELAQRPRPRKTVRRRVERLRDDPTLWTALLLRYLATTPPERLIKKGQILRFEVRRGHLVVHMSGAEGEGAPGFVRFPEVAEPFEKSLEEWLRLFDSGHLEDLAVRLRGLAGAVRDADPLIYMNRFPETWQLSRRLLELARRDREAIARLLASDVSKDGEEHALETWDGKGQLHGQVAVRLGRKRDELYVGGRKIEGLTSNMFVLFRVTSSSPGQEFTGEDLRGKNDVSNCRELVKQIPPVFASNGIRKLSPIIYIGKEIRDQRRKWVFRWDARATGSRENQRWLRFRAYSP